MRHLHCMVCQDHQKASRKLHQARNITSQLERILPRKKEKLSRPQPNKLFHETVRFMCGTCPKAEGDLQQLRQIENQLMHRFNLIKEQFPAMERQQQAQVKHLLLRLFGGHYPKACYEVQRWPIQKEGTE